MKDVEIKYSEALFGEDDILKLSNNLLPYVENLRRVATSSATNVSYKEKESSINLPFDDGVLNRVQDVISGINIEKLKYVVVVGIGGSNLGTKAIYDSLRGSLDFLSHENVPKIIFLDTINEIFLNDLLDILKRDIQNKEEVLINIVSKSGATTETIVNFEILNSCLGDTIGNVDSRIIITTDSDSKLWGLAEKKRLKVLEIPKSVGGRYSVFSAVGLLPLLAVGVDVSSLLLGAREMRDKCIGENIETNLAFISSTLIYLHNQNGIKIHNSFFFNPELESLGKWYRQLTGESIGKRFNTEGKEVGCGITPIVSIGSTDLHSMAQLYFGGPKDKFTTFVYAEENNKKFSVPKKLMMNGLVASIANKNISDIMNSIFVGVKSSYKKNNLPFMEIIIPEINEYSLGQFMQFKMIEMMYLAHLLGVNAFDQPDVEGYKEETRKILIK